MGKGALWRDVEVDSLLDIVAKYLPLEREDWTQCESAYNQEKDATRKRSAKSMKRKFSVLKNIDKPTGNVTLPPRIRRAKQIQEELEKKSSSVNEEDGYSSTQDEVNSQQHQLAKAQVETSETIAKECIDTAIVITLLSPSVSLSPDPSLGTASENMASDDKVVCNLVPKSAQISNTVANTLTGQVTPDLSKERENQALISSNVSSMSKETLQKTAQMSLEKINLNHDVRKRKRDCDKVFEAIENVNSQLAEFQNNISRLIQDATRSILEIKERELKIETDYRRQALDLQKQAVEIARLDLEERCLDRQERHRREDRLQQEKFEERRKRTRDRERERDEQRQEHRRALSAVRTK
ncbi:hypothetical protein HI914_01810 [Erysiphe necator]|nr:hypothetical protein HI914_01810 [Erysiphe necator]